MKIKLLKNHVLGKQGDIIKTNYHRAKYLIAMGVALEHKQTKADDDFKVEFKIDTNALVGILDAEEKKKDVTEKITVDNGSNTKKRATRKRKTNVKP